MTTPIIHFSDLHLDHYSVPGRTKQERLEDFLEVIRDAFKMAFKKKAKYITFGGDWNNVPKFINTIIENEGMKLLYEMFHSFPGISILAISGNHDYATKNLIHSPAQTSIQPYAYAFPANFSIIDNCIVEVGEGQYIAGIPYYEYAEHYSQALNAMVEKRSKLSKDAKVTLLIHQTPSGVNDMMKADTDATDPRYENFDMILCGHIHIVKYITDKFILTGNALQKDMGEAGQEKGLWIYDAENPVQSLKFISRKGRYPEFLKVVAGTKIDPNSKDIIRIIPEQVKVVVDEVANDNFNAALSHTDMLRNYWNITEGKDEDILQVGLELLS